MKQVLIDFKNNLSASLKFGHGGYSARKITSLFVMLMVLAAHIMWMKHCYVKDNFDSLPEILIIDYGFVAALLGMTTYSQNIQHKAKPNETPVNNPNSGDNV